MYECIEKVGGMCRNVKQFFKSLKLKFLYSKINIIPTFISKNESFETTFFMI